jgi:hypothetical protein
LPAEDSFGNFVTAIRGMKGLLEHERYRTVTLTKKGGTAAVGDSGTP